MWATPQGDATRFYAAPAGAPCLERGGCCMTASAASAAGSPTAGAGWRSALALRWRSYRRSGCASGSSGMAGRRTRPSPQMSCCCCSLMTACSAARTRSWNSAATYGGAGRSGCSRGFPAQCCRCAGSTDVSRRVGTGWRWAQRRSWTEESGAGGRIRTDESLRNRILSPAQLARLCDPRTVKPYSLTFKTNGDSAAEQRELDSRLRT